MTTTITVCVTCRTNRETKHPAGEQTDGERLSALLRGTVDSERVVVREFECLARCDNACNVAVQAPAKIGYAITSVTPSADSASDIAEFAASHADSVDGFVPWRERPDVVKKQCVARVPDLEYRGNLVRDVGR